MNKENDATTIFVSTIIHLSPTKLTPSCPSCCDISYEIGKENYEESQGPDNSLMQETMHCDAQAGITGSSYFR
jgi:hypothetical protein